ncbi:aureocin A53 family class IId bacteriocin [Terribacillus saccharophilus]
MAAAWALIARLSGAAYNWAARNIGTVWNWIKNGATFEWISDKIDSIIN